jgi:preprotein translocase subunit SecG
MHRMTTVSFVLFVVLSMTLAILSGKRHESVMESVTVATPTPVASVPATEPALAAPPPSDTEAGSESGPAEAPADAE